MKPAMAQVFERNTRQRNVIRAVFDGAERPLSIEEVLALAQRARKRVSLSTVYRFVRSLVDDGSLDVIELPGQGAYYELAGKAHHHHFSCIRCGRAYELDGCVRIEDLVLPKGFSAVSHDLSVAGVCAACTTARASRAAPLGPRTRKGPA
jgi:Fur family ferric uptake transcriptional regulator